MPLDLVLEDFASNFDVPVIYDFPYGHIFDKVIIPHGGIGSIDTQRNVVKMNY
ncbi:MAG: hypothetical protein ACRC37_01375 [Lentisphaeria bacterium]